MLRLFKDRVPLKAPHPLHYFSTSSVFRLECNAEERAREDELRQKVQQKYRGMQIPPVTNHQYGHFSTMGINAAAAQQAAGNGGAQGFGNLGGTMFQGQRKVDWLMLFTGCALVYYSGKIFFRQLTRGVNGLEMPLWTASVELQAKHLLFAVQFDTSEQELIKADFERFRQTNPFIDFFEFVRSRRPEFSSGRKYGTEYVMNTLISSLCSGDGTQLATLARTLQRSLSRRSGDSLQRVDDFVEGLHKSGSLLQGVRPMTSLDSPSGKFSVRDTIEQGCSHRSDLSTALDAKSGEVHGSVPFDGSK